MSSVIKKSSQFLHLKKKPIKRKVNNVAAATPPATQEGASTTQTTQLSSSTIQPTQLSLQVTALATPESTQVGGEIQHSFEFKQTTNNTGEVIVDPKDSSDQVDDVNLDDDLDKQDEEHSILPPPPPPPQQQQQIRSRRTSEVASRRLSGITPVTFRNRSGSVISNSGDSGNVSKPAPAKIGIPVQKVTKRRRSSAARASARTDPIIPNLVVREPSPLLEEQPDIEEEEIVNPVDDGTSEFVIAVDPNTKRLKKFRRNGQIGDKNELNQDSKRDILTEPLKVAKIEVLEKSPSEIETKSFQEDSKKNIPSIRRKRLRQNLHEDNEETTISSRSKANDQEFMNTSELELEPDTASRTGSDIDDEQTTSISRKHKKIPILPTDSQRVIHGSNQLPRSVKDEDAELYENIGLDTNIFKIADLCKPSFPIGKLSSNFQRAQEAEKKMKQQKLKRRQERKTAREERIPLEKVIARSTDSESLDESKRKVEKLLTTDVEPTNSTQLQMKLDSSGKMVVDEDSLTRNRHGNVDRSNRVVEEANPFENPVISTTYGKRRYTDRWTSEEVKQFYVALSTFGTDFSLIAQLFPYRNRKQVKLKFNLEEKKYPEVIEMALKRKLPADFDKYCRDSGNKIETLEYYNSQLEKVRIEHQLHINQIEEEKQKAAREDAEASRRREFEIRTGIKPMSRKEKQQEYRKNEMVVGSIDDIKKQPVE